MKQDIIDIAEAYCKLRFTPGLTKMQEEVGKFSDTHILSFNGLTIIQFDIPSYLADTVNVYSIIGRKVNGVAVMTIEQIRRELINSLYLGMKVAY